MVVYLWEHYGDVASVFGLILAICGFGFTLRDVNKAKRAAEEARQAARDAVTKIGSHLLANEVGTSLQLVREIEEACRARNWSIATYRCDEVRARLSQLQDDPGLDPDSRRQIREAADDFRVIIAAILDAQGSADGKDLPARVAKSLHGMILFLGRVKGRLQSVILEV